MHRVTRDVYHTLLINSIDRDTTRGKPIKRKKKELDFVKRQIYRHTQVDYSGALFITIGKMSNRKRLLNYMY